MKSILVIAMVIILFNNVYPQDKVQGPTQTIKGTVVDFQTQQPIPGVSVFVVNTKLGAYTKNDGSFKIKNVPVGRWSILFKAVGHETQMQNIVLSSGSELQIHIQLEESYVQTEPVTVSAETDRFASLNESALTSARVFTVDDVTRFAGSRMDVARMAQNFAGVLGANDSRNDIIIRGGSPTELLWRLDGLDIPNPNHFATQGATGGPVSALNHNLIDNSDFMTGAFPADYGNKMSGVFDIHTKKGNDEKYEYLGGFGINDLEAGVQGPVQFMKGSFIANYRYSFFDLLEKMGVNFGFAGIPRYQDGMFKLDLAPSSKDKISLTGLFGISDINILNSKLDTVFTGDFDIKNGTDILSLGLNWQHLFSDVFYTNFLVGTVYGRYRTDLDSITTDKNMHVISLDKWFHSSSTESYHTIKVTTHYLPEKRHFFTLGLEARVPDYNLNEKRFTMRDNDKVPWLLETKGTSLHFLGFINWNFKLTPDLTLDAGLLSQYLKLTDKLTLEPRLAMSWKFTPFQSFNAGFGVHRQSLPLQTFFYSEANKNFDFMQSIHYVAGYRFNILSDAEIRVEGYYKDISKVPVEKKPSSFSFLNVGANFGSVGGNGVEFLDNGVGRSYGAEFSLVKNFSNGYYVTATASYVRQQYRGSDNIWRFGAFDNIYIMNLLTGYELVLSPTYSLEFSGKYTTAGGSPFMQVDIEKSKMNNSTYFVDSTAFSQRKTPYSRLDLRVDFRSNYKAFSIVAFLSTENVLNTKNILYQMYNVRLGEVQNVNQLGFFFVGGVKFEF